MSDKAQVLQEVCKLVSKGDLEGAAHVLELKYPLLTLEEIKDASLNGSSGKLKRRQGELTEQTKRAKRKYSPKQATEIFVRDGFIDRYSGERLVFTGTMRLISKLLPKEFPYQGHGKFGEEHQAYWDLWPTIDHKLPICRGGADEPSNWICTSMRRNLLLKSDRTPEEMGWILLEEDNCQQWDGLMKWFVECYEVHPQIQQERFFKERYKIAIELV